MEQCASATIVQISRISRLRNQKILHALLIAFKSGQTKSEYIHEYQYHTPEVHFNVDEDLFISFIFYFYINNIHNFVNYIKILSYLLA